MITGTDVFMLVVNENGIVYTFSTKRLRPIVAQTEGRTLLAGLLQGGAYPQPEAEASEASIGEVGGTRGEEDEEEDEDEDEEDEEDDDEDEDDGEEDEDEDDGEEDEDMEVVEEEDEDARPTFAHASEQQSEWAQAKLNIEYVSNKRRRDLIFQQRKATLMRQTSELTIQTGTEALLLVCTHEPLAAYTFTTRLLAPMVNEPQGRDLIQRCLNARDSP